MKIESLAQIGDNVISSCLKHTFTIVVFFITFYTLWFMPSLLDSQLLGPGDGYIQSLPAYYAQRTLWTTQLLGGFPSAADVTPQTWYPVSLLLSRLPHSWNVFVISSYVLASTFTYGYVYLITRSALAGLVAGLTYGCSGFMMAHLGHISMVHTATWIPLTLLACENLLRSRRKKWLAFLAFAIASLFIAGHPQISVYGLGLVTAYAAFFGAFSPTRWRFYGLFSIAIITGIGLSAIQLLPTAELARITPRAEMSFQDYLAFSMPLSHAVMAVFPFIFGGGERFPFLLPYIGLSSPTEIPIYMGLLPLSLAIVGGRMKSYPQSFRYFWAIVAVISFLLMLGATTPIAWIFYQIPGYNKFRIPSRHGVELAMAVSVLAGLGIKAIQTGEWNEQNLKKMLRISVLSMGLLTLWGIIACCYFLQKNNLTTPQLYTSFLSAAIIPSLILFFLGWLSLTWHVRKRSTITVIALLVILTIDLSTFGWFYGWRGSPKMAEILPVPPFLKKYQSSLKQQNHRFFPLQGGNGAVSTVPPNLSRIWNANSMSGYGPFLISRVGAFISSNPAGVLSSSLPLWSSQNLSLDLSAVRYLTTTAKQEIAPLIPDDGSKWSHENLSISLGSVCLDKPVQSIDINLTEPLVVDSINLVGNLGCSTITDQGSNILEIEVMDLQDKPVSYFLKAGQDLSEVGIECPKVAPQMRHQIATVFQKTPTPEPNCLSNSYVSKTNLKKLTTIRQLRLNIPSGNNSAIHLHKISFNNSKTGASYPFLGGRWKYLEDLGDVRVYENLNVMPRAWLTSQVQSAQPEEILAAVHTSKLPNGETFNPRTTALIEEAIDFPPTTADPSATVQVEFPTETQVRVQTHSTQPSFLVLSDVFYPGWEAHIDGKPAHIFQTDYILRGLKLPSGDHTISFSFRPKSFAIGCGVAGASFALLLYLVISDRQNGQIASTHISPIHHESI